MGGGRWETGLVGENCLFVIAEVLEETPEGVPEGVPDTVLEGIRDGAACLGGWDRGGVVICSAGVFP